MTTQLLFYNEVVPVTSERHQGWYLSADRNYSFAENINSVPLMAVEFLNASADFPIVFVGDDESVMPVLLLGFRSSENVFIGDDGEWKGRYIPAFVRRYPFVFSRSDDGEKFYLCIDESYPGFNQIGEGEALLDEDGKPTEYTDGILKFLSQYQAEYNRTKAVCQRLKELNLLELKRADAVLPSGAKTSLSGFYAVDRSRLSTLTSDVIVDLVRTGLYELICQHLVSLRNFSELRDRTHDDPLLDAGASADVPAA